MTVEAYQLIAYQVGTDEKVLNWPNVGPSRRFSTVTLSKMEIKNGKSWVYAIPVLNSYGSLT